MTSPTKIVSSPTFAVGKDATCALEGDEPASADKALSATAMPNPAAEVEPDDDPPPPPSHDHALVKRELLALPTVERREKIFDSKEGKTPSNRIFCKSCFKPPISSKERQHPRWL